MTDLLRDILGAGPDEAGVLPTALRAIIVEMLGGPLAPLEPSSSDSVPVYTQANANFLSHQHKEPV